MGWCFCVRRRGALEVNGRCGVNLAGAAFAPFLAALGTDVASFGASAIGNRGEQEREEEMGLRCRNSPD